MKRYCLFIMISTLLAGCGERGLPVEKMATAKEDELAQAAIDGPEETGKQAARELANRARAGAELEQTRRGLERSRSMEPASAEAMRTVLQDSSQEEVRAQMAEELGKLRDIDSLPALADALEDDSPLVRRKAADAVRRVSYLSTIDYDPDASAAERKQAADLYRKYWEEIQDTALLQSLRDPRFLKAQKDAARRRKAQKK